MKRRFSYWIDRLRDIVPRAYIEVQYFAQGHISKAESCDQEGFKTTSESKFIIISLLLLLF